MVTACGVRMKCQAPVLNRVNEVPSTCGILYAFDTANLKAL